MNKIYICTNVMQHMIPTDSLYEIVGGEGYYIITNLSDADKTAFILAGTTLDELTLQDDGKVYVFEEGFGRVYKYIEEGYHKLAYRVLVKEV